MANGANGASHETVKHHARVQSGEGHLDIYGYSLTLPRTILFYIFSFFTLGIFRLIIHWKEEWYIKVRATKCSLDQANILFIVDENQTTTHRLVKDVTRGSDGNPLILPNGLGSYREVSHIRYFSFRKMLYAWFEKEAKFIPPSDFDSSGHPSYFYLSFISDLYVSSLRPIYPPYINFSAVYFVLAGIFVCTVVTGISVCFIKALSCFYF